MLSEDDLEKLRPFVDVDELKKIKRDERLQQLKKIKNSEYSNKRVQKMIRKSVEPDPELPEFSSEKLQKTEVDACPSTSITR